jgi:hypothetical protein
MATFLSKLFKPKWQSSNSETRKQALTQLDSHKTEDLAILLQLAEKDVNPEVQHAAIQKISDTQALIKLHKTAGDKLRPLTEKRLYELANAQSLSIFDLILDMDILSDMIIKAMQADSFICGLARIEHSPTLLKIAMQARNAMIRQAAAELIETEDELNQLFAHARNKDKTVFQIARSKLSRLRELAHEQRLIREKIDKLLKDLETLSQTEALQHFDARLAHLVKQWSEVDAHASASEQQRFRELAELCEIKKDSIVNTVAQIRESSPQSLPQSSSEQEVSAQAQDASEVPQIPDELQSAVSTLQETLLRFKARAATTADISALDALIKTQENRWIEAIANQDANKALEKAYQDSISQLRSYLQALRALKEQYDTLHTLTVQLDAGLVHDKPDTMQTSQLLATRKQLGQVLDKIDWPAPFAQPGELSAAKDILQATAALKQQQAEWLKQTESNVERLLKALDKALDEKQIKPASKLLKDIQSCIKPLSAQQSHKFQAAISLRMNQLNDLRDWQGFASTPKQVELCEAMERLTELHIDPSDKAEKIKTMQLEWKALGGTADKALWERFKQAADKAFEPCALFFAEQQQLKENNLKKRETLVEQLQTYLNSVDWEAVSSQAAAPAWTTSDWKTADRINRQARQEWKEAFPIDFKAGKEIQQAFNQLIEQFDQHLEAEKAFNLARKQTVVAQAKALLEETDAQKTIQQVKGLQESWQKIGITHHKADRQLWTEYRKICDEIFARREQMREAQRSEMDQAVREAEQQCQTIEASITNIAELSDTQLNTLSSAHRKSLQTLPDVPAGMREKFSKRIEGVLSNIAEELARRDQQQRVAIWQEVARKAALIRSFFAGSHHQATHPQDAAGLDHQFASTLTLPEDLEKALDSLWSSIKDNSNSIERIDSEQARSLCIQCEIAAGIESPQADKALRMQLQVNRLTEGLAGASVNLSPIAQLEMTLRQWYLSIISADAELDELEQRIGKAVAALLTK